MILRYVGFSRSLVKYGLACLGRFAPCLAQRSFLENKATVFLFLSFTCFFVFVFSPFFLFHSVREEFYCCTIFSFFCFISPSHLIFVFFLFFFVFLFYLDSFDLIWTFIACGCFFAGDGWRDYIHRSVVVVCWSKMRNMRRYISDPHGSRSPSRGGGSLV